MTKAISSFQKGISIGIYSGISLFTASILFYGSFCGSVLADDDSTIPSLFWSPHFSTNYYPIAGSPGQAQGIATDGTNLYTTHNLNIVKTLKTAGVYTLVASNYFPFPVGVGNFNHMLDIEYHNGKLYGGAMKYNNGAVATSSNSCILVYNATTLALESYAFVTNEMYCLTAMTVAPEEGLIYATYVNPLTATNLFVYDLVTFAFIRSVPLSRPIFQCQDLEYKNGSIYAVCDNFNGAGMVFEITTNGIVADRPQMFLTPQGHEAEGIDISGSELLYYPAGSTNIYSFPQIPVVATNTNESTFPMDGLRLYYSFSETNVTPFTFDRSSLANHGFFSKLTTNFVTAGLTGGGYQGAVGSYVSVQGENVSGWSNITVNAWTKHTDSLGALQVIASKYYYGGGKNHGEWWLNNFDASIGGRIINESGVQVGVNGKVPPLADGKWHMVSMTYDGTNISLYFDGQFITNAAQTGKMGVTPFPIQVGGFNAFNQSNFKGSMDELKIWDRALSAREIRLEFENAFSFPFTSIRVSNQSVDLTWQSVADAIYALESSTDLVNWVPLATNLTSSNTTLFFTTNISLPQGFFRASRAP